MLIRAAVSSCIYIAGIKLILGQVKASQQGFLSQSALESSDHRNAISLLKYIFISFVFSLPYDLAPGLVCTLVLINNVYHQS